MTSLKGEKRIYWEINQLSSRRSFLLRLYRQRKPTESIAIESNNRESCDDKFKALQKSRVVASLFDYDRPILLQFLCLITIVRFYWRAIFSTTSLQIKFASQEGSGKKRKREKKRKETSSYLYLKRENKLQFIKSWIIKRRLIKSESYFLCLVSVVGKYNC